MKKRKSLSPIERFIALPDAQKDAEVAEFEKGTDPKDWHPLTPAQRRQWARIQRKGGRPKVGRSQDCPGQHRAGSTQAGGFLREAAQPEAIADGSRRTSADFEAGQLKSFHVHDILMSRRAAHSNAFASAWRMNGSFPSM